MRLLAAVLFLTVASAGCFNDLPLLGPSLPADYVSGDDYQKWLIEIDYVEGHKPTSDATNLLAQRMRGMVDKASVSVQVDDVIPAGRSSWSDSDIRALSRQYQDADHGDGTVVTHVLYLDGSYTKGNVLGITYGDKELVAMFDETIEDSANLFFSATQIERAVLVHEFGHVIGLVDSGTPMARNHEDGEHQGHSNNRDSVMYWAVETTDITQIFTGGIPTTFDADDQADVCQAGGKC